MFARELMDRVPLVRLILSRAEKVENEKLSKDITKQYFFTFIRHVSGRVNDTMLRSTPRKGYPEDNNGEKGI